MHPSIGAAILLLFLLSIVTVCYLGTCWVWPFANCRRCGGLGRFHSPSGRAWRPCRRCKGSGGRLRFGRRVLNLIRRLHRDSIR